MVMDYSTHALQRGVRAGVIAPKLLRRWLTPLPSTAFL